MAHHPSVEALLSRILSNKNFNSSEKWVHGIAVGAGSVIIEKELFPISTSKIAHGFLKVIPFGWNFFIPYFRFKKKFCLKRPALLLFLHTRKPQTDSKSGYFRCYSLVLTKIKNLNYSENWYWFHGLHNHLLNGSIAFGFFSLHLITKRIMSLIKFERKILLG